MRLARKSLSPPSRREDEMIHHSQDSFRRMRWEEKREQCHFLSPRHTHTHTHTHTPKMNRPRWKPNRHDAGALNQLWAGKVPYKAAESVFTEGTATGLSFSALFHDARANGINRRSVRLWGETIQIWTGSCPSRAAPYLSTGMTTCCSFWVCDDIISSVTSFLTAVCRIYKAKTIIMTELIGSICAKLIRRPFHVIHRLSSIMWVPRLKAI